MIPSRSDIARQIVVVCHRLYEKGFVSATDGNVSARLPNGNILTTRTAINKGRVRESDLVEVKPDGTPITLSLKPSTELGMHLFIYKQRPDVYGVVHAHPAYATGFATARIALTECVFPEVILGLGAIPLAPYATPSTHEVAASLAPYVGRADAILLANHGVVTYGATLDEAYFKMEKVEHAAHIMFVARVLGGAHVLSPDEVEKLRAAGATAYGIQANEKIPCEPSPAANNAVTEDDIKQLIREILGSTSWHPINPSTHQSTNQSTAGPA